MMIIPIELPKPALTSAEDVVKVTKAKKTKDADAQKKAKEEAIYLNHVKSFKAMQVGIDLVDIPLYVTSRKNRASYGK